MKKWVKRFFYDLSNLSRIRFFAKYVLPLLILFFTWGVLGQLSQMGLTTKSLIANKGEVFSIGMQVEYGHTQYGSYKLYPLKILLYKAPLSFENFKELRQFRNLFDEFRLKDNFSEQFPLIEDEVHPGDTITIYTRSKWQTFLGWGRKNDIYQIQKNDKVLFSIDDMLAYKNHQIILLSVFLFVSLLGYLIYRLKFKEKTLKNT